jgi:cellobiose phosphorylase
VIYHKTESRQRIAPVIPADWTGFEVKRLYRGVTYVTIEATLA